MISEHDINYEASNRNFNDILFVDLKGNPLPPDILSLYNEPRGIEKLLTHLLDGIHGKLITCHIFDL